jgi:hypothetical protein
MAFFSACRATYARGALQPRVVAAGLLSAICVGSRTGQPGGWSEQSSAAERRSMAVRSSGDKQL